MRSLAQKETVYSLVGDPKKIHSYLIRGLTDTGDSRG